MNPEAQKLYEEMKIHLGKVVPDFELAYKAEIAVEINALKKEKNAVILGHNYMEPVLFYSIPDFKGDSLDLSRKAAQTRQGYHRFLRCQVHGRDRKNPESHQDRAPARRKGGLLAGGEHHRRGCPCA